MEYWCSKEKIDNKKINKIGHDKINPMSDFFITDAVCSTTRPPNKSGQLLRIPDPRLLLHKKGAHPPACSETFEQRILEDPPRATIALAARLSSQDNHDSTNAFTKGGGYKRIYKIISSSRQTDVCTLEGTWDLFDQQAGWNQKNEQPSKDGLQQYCSLHAAKDRLDLN
jgi:hypothetical protein